VLLPPFSCLCALREATPFPHPTRLNFRILMCDPLYSLRALREALCAHMPSYVIRCGFVDVWVCARTRVCVRMCACTKEVVGCGTLPSTHDQPSSPPSSLPHTRPAFHPPVQPPTSLQHTRPAFHTPHQPSTPPTSLPHTPPTFHTPDQLSTHPTSLPPPTSLPHPTSSGPPCFEAPKILSYPTPNPAPVSHNR
jgi:hypothetical protein